MLKECIEIFKKEYTKKGDRLITDDYIPSDGTYVLVSVENDKFKIKESFDIIYNKKTKEVQGKDNIYYKKICEFDYNSKLLSMNKPIDSKKVIHSNNYLSFFIKKESLSNNKLTENIIDNYYDILANPKIKYTKPKAKEFYSIVENDLDKIDLDLVDKIRGFIKENIFTLEQQGINIEGKDYLKIFFDVDIKNYLNEGSRYFILNLFNSNDFNQNINGDIYGLPNDNMNLNSKKPYLENKSRKNKLPNILSYKEVLIQKKFFDYLLNQASKGKSNIYVTDEKIIANESSEMPKDDLYGYYLRLKKGTEVEIIDFDIINDYKFILDKQFKLHNVVSLDEKYLEDNYKTYIDKKEIQLLLDNFMFSKFLINNYFNEPGDISIKDNILKRNILLCRNKIFNYIYKGDEVGLYKVLDKSLEDLINENIKQGRYIKATHQFNLKISLKNYFEGGENMADIIHKIKEDLREKINSNQTQSIKQDDEYYFAVGQLVNYLLSKSKSKNTPHHLINSFINAKNDKFIKDKLRVLYKKYNYDDNMNGKRVKNLYAMILSYTPEGNINEDIIIAGFLHSSLIYEKIKGEEVNE